MWSWPTNGFKKPRANALNSQRQSPQTKFWNQFQFGIFSFSFGTKEFQDTITRFLEPNSLAFSFNMVCFPGRPDQPIGALRLAGGGLCQGRRATGSQAGDPKDRIQGPSDRSSAALLPGHEMLVWQRFHICHAL